MPVLAIVLACLACQGHGRRVLMESQGPTYYGPSGRRGVTKLGDTEDFRDMNTRKVDPDVIYSQGPSRGSYGREAQDDIMGNAEEVYPTRIRRWSAAQNTNSNVQFSATENFRERHTRRADSVESDLDDVRVGYDQDEMDAVYETRRPRHGSAYQTRGRVAPLGPSEDFRERHTRRAGSANDEVRGGYVSGARRLQRESAGQDVNRNAITNLGPTEDFREKHTRRAMPRHGFNVRPSFTKVGDTEDFRANPYR